VLITDCGKVGDVPCASLEALGTSLSFLKPKGIFLFSIHHPVSEIKLLHVPNYFSTELIIDRWIKEGKTFEVPF
jgi:hypothetical protein